MATLLLLRHGQSDWNEKNLFTGWVDVPLSATGEAEARRGGELMAEAGLLPDVVHTSLLRRAISTANIALDVCDRHWIPVVRNWRLNERHYGALQGKDKKQTLAEFGEEQFMLWRRSYDVPPPPIEPGSEFSQDGDPRYADLGADMPATECLADVVKRFLPYYEGSVIPDLQAGKVVLLAAHGNSLRALVKHLDGISDEAIAGLNIPTGIPLRYELDDDFKPITPGGEYLDPEAAKEAAAVANQGRDDRARRTHPALRARRSPRAGQDRAGQRPRRLSAEGGDQGRPHGPRAHRLRHARHRRRGPARLRPSRRPRGVGRRRRPGDPRRRRGLRQRDDRQQAARACSRRSARTRSAPGSRARTPTRTCSASAARSSARRSRWRSCGSG